MEIGRNTIEGFGVRVQKNLDFMLQARADGADVHVVTDLTTALLGLIVFPAEYFKRHGMIDFQQFVLDDLTAKGWPSWKFSKGTSKDLKDLLRRLRNATSHYRVHFSSDARDLADVTITFSDRRTGSLDDEWVVEIQADDLLAFVRRFAGLVSR